MLINDIIKETTTSGGISLGAMSGGPMHKRPNPSVFVSKGKKKKVREDQSYDDLRVAKYLCYNDNKKFSPYGTQMEYIKKAEDMREQNPDKYLSILRQPSPPSDDSWASKFNRR